MPAAGWADDKDPLKLDNIPTFGSTSNEPVRLRYKLKAGQTQKMVVDMDMDMRLDVGGQQINMKQTMTMEAKAAATAVDADGNIAEEVKITRMKMKVTGPGGTVEFDSDKPSDDPKFQVLKAMINVGIPCKMSPVGKMLKTDMEPLRLAVSKADAALAKSLEDSTKQMFDGTFIQLSETPVKAGDTYKAGTVVSDKAKINMSYKIRLVSGDKNKAVLEPVAVIDMGAGTFPPGVDAKIKKQQMAGWILFDVQKGYASKADIRMNMVLDINSQGQTGSANITAKSTVTSSVE